MSFNNFSEFLKAVQANAVSKKTDARLKFYSAGVGANESVPSSGGFLIPTEFSSKLIERIYQTGVILDRTQRFPVTEGNSIKFPAFDETSRADGSRFGGLQAFWGDEGSTLTASQPKLMAEELTLKKLYAFVTVTSELLNDAPSLEKFLTEAVSKEFSFKVEDGMVNGDGSGKLKGVLSHAGSISVAKESGQGASTIVYANIKKMVARMWGPSRRNAVWLINQDVEEQLSEMTVDIGTAGTLAYNPASGPIVDGYPSLYGRPVIPVEFCETLGTAGDIILADFSQYLFIDREPENVLSMHVRFIQDEGSFRFVWRVDGQPSWHSVLTPKNSTSSQSPFISLATRA